jgi:hypothetical protein
LIKKIKGPTSSSRIRQRRIADNGLQHEIEGYSALEAARHLTKVFGLKDLPRPEVKAHRDLNAAVERVTQQAIAAGVKMPIEELRKEIEKRLKPVYPTIGMDVKNLSNHEQPASVNTAPDSRH